MSSKARELADSLQSNAVGFSVTSGTTTDKTLTVLSNMTLTSEDGAVINLNTLTPDYILFQQGII